MGATPGNVIYQTRGQKLRRGFDDVPVKIKDYVLSHKPEFLHAPSSWPAGQRNTTSWSYFKALSDSGNYTPTCAL